MTAVQVLPFLAVLSLSSSPSAPVTPSFAPAFDSVEQILLSRNRLRGYRFNVRPSRYRGGAFSRGDCPVDAQEKLQAIVPDPTNIDDVDLAASESAANIFGGIPAYQNAASHPVFLLHAPAIEGASGVLYVEIPTLSLRERQQYKVAFELSDQAGILGIQVPQSAPALEVGQTYRWRVAVECSPEDDELDIISFNSAVYEQVTDIDGDEQTRLSYYLEQGIWQDTAVILADARANSLDADADEEWAVFMDVSGTPQFVEAPVIDIQVGRLLSN